MAIEYSLRIGKMMPESLLIQELESMGYKNIDVVELSRGIEIRSFEETLGLTLYLTESGAYPYNAYDTQFLQNEFVYESALSFRFINNLHSNKSFEFMLALVFNLMKNHSADALFLSNGDNELCFFSKGSVYLENSSHVWDTGCFAEILKGHRYSIFDGNHILLEE
ncbi:hypothetical protein PAEVO_52780 [Paenibacillus sp. GM2FR]|jgi:hypothetical protein|uniref:SitI3 family protein n=1 Tax=Paenibacillus TaxID=44249 RepID=UPI000C2783BC|nr:MULTISPECIES: SitI3 family protein [Paenibacillus]MDL1162938.1 SitI3 family protein [Yersinia pestis]MEC0259693.1 SitI3 family protein [Paenibacillus lautus]PJN50234.1 hypothetical protein PAEVO_52780 [Paenibacillus sp. GM2FR]